MQDIDVKAMWRVVEEEEVGESGLGSRRGR